MIRSKGTAFSTASALQNVVVSHSRLAAWLAYRVVGSGTTCFDGLFRHLSSFRAAPIVLQEHQLAGVVSQLQNGRPKSLQIEAQMRNHLQKKHAWPGTEFVVDRFPDFSAVWSRPIKGSQEYVARGQTPTVSLYSQDPSALKEICSSPGFVDWSTVLTFAAVDREMIAQILADECRKRGTLDGGDSVQDDFGVAFSFDPQAMASVELPTGFRPGKLSLADAAQVNAEWRYGVPESLLYIQCLLKLGVPNAAVFAKVSNKPVAYALYAGDGSLGFGYVDPNFRRQGLYQYVVREAAKSVQEIGQQVVWAYVDNANTASLKAFRKMGGKELDWTVEWIRYKPRPRQYFPQNQ